MPAPGILKTPFRQYMRDRRGAIGHLIQLAEHLSLGTPIWYDDFMGAVMRGGEATEGGGTLLSSYQSTASGAASAAAAIQSAENGEMLLDPGTADNGRSDWSLGLHFAAYLNPVFICRLNSPTVALQKVEMGFTDVVSGTDAGGVNDLSVPSFTATDGVFIVKDTDDTALWQLAGVDSGTASTKIESSHTAATQADGTYQTLVLALEEYDGTNDIGQAKMYIFDANEEYQTETAWMTAAVTSTTRLTPWLFVQNRSAAQRTLEVDYVAIYQRRSENA